MAEHLTRNEKVVGSIPTSSSTRKGHLLRRCPFLVVRVVGLEPTRLSAEEPKSSESTNSTIPADMSGRAAGLLPLFYPLCFYTARNRGGAYRLIRGYKNRTSLFLPEKSLRRTAAGKPAPRRRARRAPAFRSGASALKDTQKRRESQEFPVLPRQNPGCARPAAGRGGKSLKVRVDKLSARTYNLLEISDS